MSPNSFSYSYNDYIFSPSIQNFRPILQLGFHSNHFNFQPNCICRFLRRAFREGRLSPTMAAGISKTPYFSGILTVVFALCVLPAVTVDDLVLRLPSEGHKLCGGAAAEASCPVKCFRTDPVCGVDGVTYWCGCSEAACAGAQVAKLGFCELGNGGSVPLSGQALLLVHIVWLIVLGFSVLFGLF
ncbi:hypothetical protein Fmac_007464 [Flemingia macrophylla]|uniref:Uncharacterized protein n=1 Tax=Flemingia macrophylla TaxID=520843 RepID=A0ABD1MUP9_9FABA